MMTETDLRIKHEWRHDGQYGYRHVSLDRFTKEYAGRTTVPMDESFSVDTDKGEVKLVDTIQFAACVFVDGTRLFAPDDGDLIAQFLRVIHAA